MNNVAVFVHVATVNKYQQVFEEVFGEIINSGLLEHSDVVRVCAVGNGDLMLPEANNIIVDFDPSAADNSSQSINYGEFYTLTKLKEFANTTKENTKILYCHLRGVTSPDNEFIPTWREYLIHHNITNFKNCLSLLDEYDACGTDLITKDKWPYADHFSGNFWWANSDHIRKLPEISEIDNPSAPQKATLRHNAEFWIGMVDGKFKSIFDADVDVCCRHLEKCPKEYYQ
jgi:hypothetical protein